MQIDKGVTYAIIGTLICVIGYLSYNWASWATETLIAVDKRTEVMSVQIDHIADTISVSYGYLSEQE